MKTGDSITVSDANDNKLLRIVLACEGDMVYVSRAEEIENAKAENREPHCIGFRLSDVVSHTNHK